MSSRFAQFIDDYRLIVSKWYVWYQFGLMDIKQRYRGSVLGPFWITLSMAIFVAALSLLYGRLFNQPLNTYVPFLTAGFTIWYFVSLTLIDAPNIFWYSRNFIFQANLPYTMYIMRLVFRNFIILLHNSMVFIIVMLVFQIPINWNTLLFIPGLLVVMLNVFNVGLLLAIIGTRFRDIPPLITSVIQIVFFLSPITWLPKLLNEGSLIVRFNPMVHFLDIVRQPLLGSLPSWYSWQTVLLLTVVSSILAAGLYFWKRRNIAFWL